MLVDMLAHVTEHIADSMMAKRPNKAKGRKGTISARASRQRAVDKPLRFYQLEKFVNLKDGPANFREMYETASEFLPVTFSTVEDCGVDEHPNSVVARWDDSFHDLLLVFRNMLREVWGSGSEKKLAILLGLDLVAWKIITRESADPPLNPLFIITDYSLIHSAMRKLDPYYHADLDAVSAYPKVETGSSVVPEWGTGTLRFDLHGATGFRQALYALFQQSWRAKVCPRCGKYFIADKPPRSYCSTKCYGEAKKGRDARYWRSVGSKLRQKRIKGRSN